MSGSNEERPTSTHQGPRPVAEALAPILFVLIVGGTGASILLEGLLERIDRFASHFERVLIVLATIGMTVLVFDSYLIEQTSSWFSSEAEAPQTAPAAPEEVDKAPEAVTETPAEPVAADGTVGVQGDAERVRLQQGDTTVELPGIVGPGTWQILATFAGQEEVAAGQAEITADKAVDVKCDSFVLACRVRKAKPRAASPPAPAGPAPGTVGTQGDAERVRLQQGDTVVELPGVVTPGAWQILATFAGQAETAAGEAEIPADKAVDIKCDSFVLACRVRKAAASKPVAAPVVAPVALPAPEATVAVSLVGDFEVVKLLGGETYDIPGKVPPGSYSIQAEVPGVGTMIVGGVQIDRHETDVTLRCSSAFYQCQHDVGWWNPWRGDGQINIALLLMVAMGFLGASLATKERRHIAVDVVDRFLSAGQTRVIKRLTALVSTVLCALLLYGTTSKVFDPTAAGDRFPGGKVWWWMATPINWATSLLPGAKYGPGTSFPTRDVWEAMSFPGGVPYPPPLAYPYVQPGDDIPAWIPLVFVVIAFALMVVRFAIQFIRPDSPGATVSLAQGGGRARTIAFALGVPFAVITMGLALWLASPGLIILASILLVLMGAPLFVAVGFGTLAGWWLFVDPDPSLFVTDMFNATKKQEIISIPFFVLAGNVMTNGEIARRLIDFARALTRPIPGGLGIAAVIACAVFAAISGSSPATVIAIGTIMFPMLVRAGYSENFSLGMLSTAGSLGIVIPPSVPMIVFAVMVSNPQGAIGVISPDQLFLGGVLPGLFIATMLILYTLYVNWPSRAVAAVGGAVATASFPGPPSDEPPYLKNLGLSTWRALPSLALPVLILGGLWKLFPLVGIPIQFDVTYASAVAVVYALAIELIVHRRLTLLDIPRVCIETAVMIGSLFLILVIAISLNRLMVHFQIPETATEWMLSMTSSDVTFLIGVTVLLLIVGCLMDIISAILVIAPLLAPIAVAYGIHPIHFGIMFIVNLEIGYLTPPFGINLFVASTTFERPLLKVIRSVVPFLGVMLFCLMVIIWVPYVVHRWTGVPLPGLPSCVMDSAGYCITPGSQSDKTGVP